MQEQRVAFGPFVFDRASATLWHGGSLAPLGGRAAALLAALLEADSGVVTKTSLIERAWPDTIVEEGNLAVQIATLRKILGTRSDGEEWITTISRVGYRLMRDGAATEIAAPRGRPSLAVLPFANLSSDPEQDYFADGMVDDLITSLSRFKTFAVVARNSSFVYKNRAVDIREAAKALGVRYVLEGSVRRTERQVRVNAQLIDGATGAHLWADKLDGTIEDVFAFQDGVTENVVGLIEPQIRRAEIERARRKRPESLDAYDLYLQGLSLMQGGQGVVRLEDYSNAVLLFERAVALDSGFAPALAYAAWSHEKRLTRGGVAPPGVDDAREAIALAELALAADNGDAVVLAIAGLILVTVRGDLDEGLALIKRALALNPNSLLITNIAGYAHFHGGRFDESIACHSRGLQFSSGLPDTFWSLNGIARAHLAAGRVDEALTWGLRGLEAYGGVDFAHCIVAAAYAHLDRLDEARAGVEKARSIWPELTIESLLGRGGAPDGRDRFLVEGLLKGGLPAS